MTDFTTAGIICFDKTTKKFLLMKSRFNDKLWSFPKGYINKKETPQVAALRELYEETKIQLSESDLLDNTYNINLAMTKPTKKIPSGVKIIKFYVAYMDENVEIELSKEHSKYSWMSNFSKIQFAEEYVELTKKIILDLSFK